MVLCSLYTHKRGVSQLNKRVKKIEDLDKDRQ